METPTPLVKMSLFAKPKGYDGLVSGVKEKEMDETRAEDTRAEDGGEEEEKKQMTEKHITESDELDMEIDYETGMNDERKEHDETEEEEDQEEEDGEEDEGGAESAEDEDEEHEGNLSNEDEGTSELLMGHFTRASNILCATNEDVEEIISKFLKFRDFIDYNYISAKKVFETEQAGESGIDSEFKELHEWSFKSSVMHITCKINDSEEIKKWMCRDWKPGKALVKVQFVKNLKDEFVDRVGDADDNVLWKKVKKFASYQKTRMENSLNSDGVENLMQECFHEKVVTPAVATVICAFHAFYGLKDIYNPMWYGTELTAEQKMDYMKRLQHIIDAFLNNTLIVKKQKKKKTKKHPHTL